MKHMTVWGALLGAAMLSLPQSAVAKPHAPARFLPSDAGEPKDVDVRVAKSTVIDIREGIVRVSVAEPSIADVVIPNKYNLLINGKKPGSTSLFVWTPKRRYQYDLTVKGDQVEGVDVRALQIALRRASKDGELDNVTTEVVGNRVILSGRVKRPSSVELAGKVAAAFAENVVNLVVANAPPQVQVDVQVVEVRKDGGHDLGVNWGSLRVTPTGDAVFLKDLMTFSETAPNNPVTFRQYDRLAAQLKLLVNNGLAKVLAKPKLVAASGGRASFLVGGQIPIPMMQQLGMVTITWRDYGVRLAIEPRVLDNGRIDLKVMPEVSALDYNNAVKIGGFLIPSLTSRNAETQVNLAPGEGLAIGGLMSTSETENVDKFPILGDIPILGSLFKSTQFQKNETELTILVTPSLLGTTAQPM